MVAVLAALYHPAIVRQPAMKTPANGLLEWAANLPVYDEAQQPDATITDRTRRMASEAATQPAALGLPRLEVTESADGELSVEGVLGRGGMGVVQVARQRALGRRVAVKRPRPEAKLQAMAVASLLTEARIQGALDHPNIVPVHALGRDNDDLPVLVMKRLIGVSWRALIRDASHPAWPKEAGDRFTWHLETLMQVCNAVHFAHSRGVVHRDIKPDNVMIGAFGEVYLLDWGLAYVPGPDAVVDLAVVGSPAYLAPEMLDGTGPHITPRADVYLLGATLHEVLTGKVRHQGKTVVEVLYRAGESAPYDYPESVPEELATLANQATSLDPSERPESALAFRQAIAAFLQHRGSVALAEASVARLSELRARVGAALEGGGDDPEIRALFGEASFGLRQALLLWEGNKIAREGLREAMTWMARYELSRRNAEAAAALLAALAPPPPDLTAAVEALRAELARERDELVRLRDAAHETNLVISFRPRILLIMGVGVLICSLFFGVWLWSPKEPSHLAICIVFVVGLVSVLSAVIARRKHLLVNRANRQIASVMLLLLVVGGLNHAIAGALGLSVSITMVWDMVVCAAVCALAAITVHKSFWIAPPIFLMGALFAGIVPRFAIPLATLSSLAVVIFGGLIGWRILGELERSTTR